jgi:hypothetical protein
LRSLGLRTENVPDLFASSTTVTVSVEGKSTSRVIGSHGRYGHALVVVLGEGDVFLSYDRISDEMVDPLPRSSPEKRR